MSGLDKSQFRSNPLIAASADTFVDNIRLLGEVIFLREETVQFAFDCWYQCLILTGNATVVDHFRAAYPNWVKRAQLRRKL